MGGAQAAKVMDILNRAKLERLGLPVVEDALQAMSEALRQRLDAESAALFGSARLWDDGIIDPRDTRRILGLCLALAQEADQRTLRPNSFGVARFYASSKSWVMKTMVFFSACCRRMNWSSSRAGSAGRGLRRLIRNHSSGSTARLRAMPTRSLGPIVNELSSKRTFDPYAACRP